MSRDIEDRPPEPEKLQMSSQTIHVPKTIKVAELTASIGNVEDAVEAWVRERFALAPFVKVVVDLDELHGAGATVRVVDDR